ncbi:MAG TPA: isovaleryl-CoA dehydrogenase [Xanthobacteraceae bacterium]|jgi:putative acyl-CoA dehydrogenase|nr:isovaleryl-CoA dehydrogenase [Xanthobacteraceae bacterium]
MDQITNQPPPLEPYNLWHTDRALREALVRERAGWAVDELAAFGKTLGEPETIRLGFAANVNPPVLHAFDRYGHRIDEVEFHPAWHALLSLAVEAGLHSSPWAAPRTGAHVARAAGTFMLAQVESGVYCPIAMTYGSVPALRHAPALAAEWLPRIFARRYDPQFRPAKEKTGVLLGMAMTENQGGSDLRTNTTRAEFIASDGQRRVFRLTGQKWFMSAPMCDAFLVLAQASSGLSCFLLPRWRGDGERNAIHISRLKDKLGNRSNASSEVEFAGTEGELIGEEGRGIPTIIEMSNYARLDCAIGSSGLMRQAVAQAIHHASYRVAFQKKLIDQALMTNVLADLALESEAATVLTMRLARAYDEDDALALAWRRVMTPAAKFWICKRAPPVAAEAMEVLGGSGYVEDCVLPRIYRELPVNSIWEGAGNIMCLDVLRALERVPGAAELLLAEIAQGAHAEPRLRNAVSRLERKLTALDWKDEAQARVIVRDLILAMQAALLLAHSPSPVAEAFCSSRLGDGPGGTFGLLPSGADLRAIVDRAAPRRS